MGRRFRPYQHIKYLKLDLGCGNRKKEGFIGIDTVDHGQELIWDITNGIPFPDNSIEEIYSSHLLEHLNEDQIVDLFREIYRVLKPKGIFESRLPHISSPTAFYIGHKSFWNEARIEIFLRDKEGYLGNFAILQNEKIGEELFFKLVAIK